MAAPDLASATALVLLALDDCYAAQGMPTVSAQLASVQTLTTQVATLTTERNNAVTDAANLRAEIDRLEKL